MDRATPGPVRDLVARSSAEGVKISWKAPGENIDGSPLVPLRGYRVRRSHNEGPFTSVSFVQAPFRFWGLDTISFLDRDPDLDGRYRYEVVVVNALKARSPATTTEEITFSPGAGLPVPARSPAPVLDRPIPPPKALRGARGATGEIYLWWEEADEGHAPAAVYEIGRNPAGGGEVEVIGMSETPFFTTTDPGDTFGYTVRAVDPLGGALASPPAAIRIEDIR